MPTDNTTAQQELTKEIYKRNRELLKERRHAEKLLYNVSEGVFAVDKNFVITIFNNALEEMLEIPEGSALGKPMSDYIKIETEHGEKVDLTTYCFINSSKQPILYDLVLKGKAKNYYINVKFSIIDSSADPEDSECLVTLTDITNEVLLDKAKDDFLSLASHEMKTPLTIVKGYLWMLQSNMAGPLSAEQMKYVDIAFNSTEQMILMVNDMLNVSRMEQGKLSFDIKPAKLVKTIQEVMQPFELQVQEQKIYLKLELVNCDESLDSYYDEGKLKECLINFIGNAVKFTKEGGVTVKVENSESEIKVSVIDTGVGISEDDSSKLFSKFGKMDSSYKKIAKVGGTGLGLYIVKIFIEAMGGQVGYISRGDFMGSIFWFTVPKNTILYNKD